MDYVHMQWRKTQEVKSQEQLFVDVLLLHTMTMSAVWYIFIYMSPKAKQQNKSD